MWAYGFGCSKVMFAFEGMYGTYSFRSLFLSTHLFVLDGDAQRTIRSQEGSIVSYELRICSNSIH